MTSVSRAEEALRHFGEGAAQFEGQRGEARVGESLDVPLLRCGGGSPEAEAGGEQEFATGEQRPHLEDLRRVHPPDQRPVGVAEQDGGGGCGDLRQCQHV